MRYPPLLHPRSEKIMFNRVPITLLSLAAFLLLVFSVTANAEPPFARDKDQRVVAPALRGEYHVCHVVNQSTRSIEDLLIEICSFDGNCFPSPLIFLLPNEATGLGTELSHGLSYCVVTWFGQRDDLVISHCVRDAIYSGPHACVNAS